MGCFPVIEYIEETMAEVTTCWARRPANCLTRSHEASSALRLTGSTDGCPKLSWRVDRFEQILLDTISEVKIVSVTVSPAGPETGGV